MWELIQVQTPKSNINFIKFLLLEMYMKLKYVSQKEIQKKEKIFLEFNSLKINPHWWFCLQEGFYFVFWF